MQHKDTVFEVYYQEELRQAYGRLFFLLPMLLSYCFFTYLLHSDVVFLQALVPGFVVAALVHLYAIRQFPKTHFVFRKVMTILVDMSVVGAFFYAFDNYGILFTPMFLWIIIGNGMRFGPKYFFIAIVIALSVLALVYVNSGYWRLHWETVGALAVAIVLLPFYYLTLLKRIRYKNDFLEQMLQSSQHDSRHDSLTSLPNRYYFEDELQNAVAQKVPFALLFIDLDGFKDVNDTYGHEHGDTVLKKAAERLQRCIAGDDLAARLGGDEFVVIVKTPQRASEVAKEIIAALSVPYGENGKVVVMSASIGISRFPDDARDAFFLKKYADIAMYKVKVEGKNNFIEYGDINR